MKHRIRGRGRLVAALVGTATLVMPPTAAHAADHAPQSAELTAVMFAGPANLDRDATTAALRSGKSLASLGLEEAGQRPAPTLSSYNQRLRSLQRDARRAHTAAARGLAATTTEPFDPTKPPPELKLSDCPEDSNQGPLYAPDRFDICEVQTLGVAEFLDEGGTETLQGVGYFKDTLIGAAGFGDQADRILVFHDYISDVTEQVVPGGKWNPAIVLYETSKCTPVLGSGDCHSRTDAHIAVFAQWQLAGSDSWNFTLEVDPGGGVGRDDIIKEILNEGFFVQFPPSYVAMEPGTILGLPDLYLRWDNASYVKRGDDSEGAAIFDDIPALTFNLNGQGTDQVAQHIQDALTSPDLTVPKEPPGQTKVIPGYLDNPLHRLYKNYSPPTSELRYNRNGAIARAQCGPRHGDECDEFPMASTYEGAAKAEYEPYSDPNAYSVQLVDAAQNKNAGAVLKQFYAYYRVLDPGYDTNYHPHDWDSFYIQIL